MYWKAAWREPLLLIDLLLRDVADDLEGATAEAGVQGGLVRGHVDEPLDRVVQRDAPPDADARQELRDGRALGLLEGRRAEVDAPSPLRQRPERADVGRRDVAVALDLDVLVRGRDRDELAPPVPLVGLAEEPVRAVLALAARAVALLGRDVLHLDVVAHLEVRHRLGRLS